MELEEEFVNLGLDEADRIDLELTQSIRSAATRPTFDLLTRPGTGLGNALSLRPSHSASTSTPQNPSLNSQRRPARRGRRSRKKKPEQHRTLEERLEEQRARKRKKRQRYIQKRKQERQGMMEYRSEQSIPFPRYPSRIPQPSPPERLFQRRVLRVRHEKPEWLPQGIDRCYDLEGNQIHQFNFAPDSPTRQEEPEEDYEAFATPSWKQRVTSKPKGNFSVPRPTVPAERTPGQVRVVEKEEDWYFDTFEDSLLRFFTIRDRWALLEREFHLHDITGPYKAQKMPDDTVDQVSANVSCDDTYKGTCDTHYHEFCYQPSEDLKAIKDFIETTRKYRIMSFNTEGKNRMVQVKGGKTRPRVLVTFGSLNGQVLFFTDFELVPRVLQKLLSDVSITKIGSGLVEEHKELGRLGIQLINWVDTGVLRLALYPDMWHHKWSDKVPLIGQAPFGIDAQIKDLQDNYWLLDYKRTKYCFYWDMDPRENAAARRRPDRQENERYQATGKPPRAMLPHLRENVRIPIAFAILVAYRFAIERGYDIKKTPFFPILHEAMDICRGRDPNVIQKSLDPPKPTEDFWVANPVEQTRKIRGTLPADCLELTRHRKAQADFVEIYELPDPVKESIIVFERFFGSNGIGLPTHVEMDENKLNTVRNGRCFSCGYRGHKVKDCFLEKNPTCEYPHDGANFPLHSTLCCPNLHAYCEECELNGHHPNAHLLLEHRKTARELRERYFKFMHQGAFTSMPYLIFHPEGKKWLTTAHWRFSYDAKRFNEATITRFALGIDTHIPQNDIAAAQFQSNHAKWLSDREELWTRVAYNVTLKTSDWDPIPKDLVEARLKAKAETKRAERQAKVAAQAAVHQERMARLALRHQQIAAKEAARLAHQDRLKQEKEEDLRRELDRRRQREREERHLRERNLYSRHKPQHRHEHRDQRISPRHSRVARRTPSPSRRDRTHRHHQTRHRHHSRY